MKKVDCIRILNQAGIPFEPDETYQELLAKVKSVETPPAAVPNAEAGQKEDVVEDGKDVFTTQNVKFAEMAQKALSIHPEGITDQATLIHTYIFPFSLEEIEVKVKVYKQEASAKLEKERKIAETLSAIF